MDKNLKSDVYRLFRMYKHISVQNLHEAMAPAHPNDIHDVVEELIKENKIEPTAEGWQIIASSVKSH